MKANQPSLGEQAVSKVLELGIASQFDNADEFDVEVHTNDPLKLVQGEADSVAIAASGVVTQQDLRVESLEITTDEVSINPLTALFGKVDMLHATNADVRLTLSEADINRAIASEFFRSHLQNLELHMRELTVTLDLQQPNIQLLPGNRIALSTHLFLKETGDQKQLSLRVIPYLRDQGHRIALEVESASGQGLSLEFLMALLDQIVRFLDLRNFMPPGITLQLNTLEVQPQKLHLRGKTTLEKIPETLQQS
ncbi:MAG: DUF2993 domain-containing protein [Oculatellaceae cyanobacterium Prado106]|jgi:hypothetical protein|nr:DUF2993 domain-containing protein [Oculatellaceae cyanobacterium Prado106]